MRFTSNPEDGGATTASLIASVTDLTFSVATDLYVLQLTYDDANVSAGFLESELEPLFYDPVAAAWGLSTNGNSDGGSGGELFTGSSAEFLTSPQGGGVLDAADLSFYGIDGASNQLWAVLDHASLFSVGIVGLELIGDYDDSSDVGLGDLNLVLFNWNIDGGVLTNGWVNQRPEAGTTVGLTALNGVLFN